MNPSRQQQMAAVVQSGLQRELDRMERLIGALSAATSGVAASIDDGEALNAIEIDSLFGLLVSELKDNQARLSQLVQ